MELTFGFGSGTRVPPPDALAKVRVIVEKRLAAAGITAVEVRVIGERLLVRLLHPLGTDVARAKGVLPPIGRLAVRLADDTDDYFEMLSRTLELKDYRVDIGHETVSSHKVAFAMADRREDIERLVDARPPSAGLRVGYERTFPPFLHGAELWRTYLMYDRVELGSEHIAVATTLVDKRFGEPFVSVSFDEVGTRVLAALTRANVGRRLVIEVDGMVFLAPVIEAALTDGRAAIHVNRYSTYEETLDEAARLASVLQAGPLPAPLVLMDERALDPGI